MDRPLVFFDTETATLAPPPHLLELGAVRVVNGEAESHFVSLVRPQVPIEPETTLVHGIEEGEIRDAPTAAEVLEQFNEWLGDDWLVAHNATADAQVLAFEYARADLTPPSAAILDTLPLAKRYLPDSPDHKLGTLCHYLELEADRQHRALEDAVASWKVFEACLGEMEEEPTSLEILAQQSVVTISGEGPAPPRLTQRLRVLDRACRGSESVYLLYGEPPAAPARLPVLPRLLYRRKKKDYLEAECEHSGSLKTYRLDRVQRVLPR